MTLYLGYVVLSSNRGYGFIGAAPGGQDVRYHMKDCREYKGYGTNAWSSRRLRGDFTFQDRQGLVFELQDSEMGLRAEPFTTLEQYTMAGGKLRDLTLFTEVIFASTDTREEV